MFEQFEAIRNLRIRDLSRRLIISGKNYHVVELLFPLHLTKNLFHSMFAVKGTAEAGGFNCDAASGAVCRESRELFMIGSGNGKFLILFSKLFIPNNSTCITFQLTLKICPVPSSCPGENSRSSSRRFGSYRDQPRTDESNDRWRNSNVLRNQIR